MRVVVERRVRRSAPVVWRHVTDWPWQGASIPLTRVFSTRRAGGLGDTFVGRTAVLGVGFDDPMEVIRWQEPTAGAPEGRAAEDGAREDGARAGVAVLRKHGSVVLGSAAIRVQPLTRGSCLLVWGEDVDVAPVALTRPLAPVLRVGAWWGLRAVVADMVRRVEAATPEPLEP
ncbi:hypothetical protein [Pseudokineococcus sp. 1T1Z-3]|uniref:hypothetical protein n=1 Tax=Pseudokineococcus sp. 1T1Z-3 TaxID=3132745 RepID=UPI0030A3B575